MNVHQAIAQSPAWQSCFILPRLDAAVPLELTTASTCDRVLAKFVKIAAENGVPLPAGSEFKSIGNVAAAQWQELLNRSMPSGISGENLLAGTPVIRVSKDRLQLAMQADSRLNVYQLKEVVTSLEAAKKGLGWFVAWVLKRSNAHGHTFYDMGSAMGGLPYQVLDFNSFTDEEYVRYIQENCRHDGEIVEVTPELIAQLKEEYAFWPSDLLAEVDGHMHLLDGDFFNQSWPRRPGNRTIRMWVKENPSHPYVEVVQAALALSKALDVDRDGGFGWSRRALDGSELGDDEEEYALGAAAFVTWDSPDTVMELVEHHERNIMENCGGQDYARCLINLDRGDTDQMMARLAKATAAYFKRWGLLAQLLSHLPQWSEDES